MEGGVDTLKTELLSASAVLSCQQPPFSRRLFPFVWATVHILSSMTCESPPTRGEAGTVVADGVQTTYPTPGCGGRGTNHLPHPGLWRSRCRAHTASPACLSVSLFSRRLLYLFDSLVKDFFQSPSVSSVLSLCLLAGFCFFLLVYSVE